MTLFCHRYRYTQRETRDAPPAHRRRGQRTSRCSRRKDTLALACAKSRTWALREQRRHTPSLAPRDTLRCPRQHCRRPAVLVLATTPAAQPPPQLTTLRLHHRCHSQTRRSRVHPGTRHQARHPQGRRQHGQSCRDCPPQPRRLTLRQHQHTPLRLYLHQQLCLHQHQHSYRY